MEFTLEETFDASPETVFAAVANIEAFGEWMPGFVSVNLLTEGETRLGTKFEETRKLYGKEAMESFEVTKFEPSHTYELTIDGSKGTTGKGFYVFTYSFAAEGSGTKMTMDAKITDMGKMGKLLGKIMIGSFKKAIDKDHKAIKAWIEPK